MRVSRHWNQEPGWYDTLDADNKRLVLADYLLDQENEEQRKERQARQQRRIINRARENQRKRYGQED